MNINELIAKTKTINHKVKNNKKDNKKSNEKNNKKSSKKNKENVKYVYFWDIETSKIEVDESTKENPIFMQICYLSNVLKVNSNTMEIEQSIFFRTIEETTTYFKSINEKTFVFVHNLDYELTFLLRDDDYNLSTRKLSIFRDKHSPLSVTLKEIDNITFRDTYAIFNKSVEKMGDEIGMTKGVIDGSKYDYSKIRTPWDKLTDDDYFYNEQDNKIVFNYLKKYMLKNGYNFNDIPLTFTSENRKKRNDFITKDYGEKTQYYYIDKEKSLINIDIQELFSRVYQGGLTASILPETGKVHTNYNSTGVVGYDIKSSYPSQMISRKYPRYEEDNRVFGSKANELFHNIISHNKRVNFNEDRKVFFIANVKITDLEIKNINYILPLSKAHCEKSNLLLKRIEKGNIFNGKVIGANTLYTLITDVEYEIIDMMYNYNIIQCDMILTTTKRNQLREGECSYLLNNFLIKETTKDKEQRKESKLRINSTYGIKVTSFLRDEFTLIDSQVENIDFTLLSKEEKEMKFNDIYNNVKKRSGSYEVYSDGVYITCYARKQLIEFVKLIVDNKGKVVYSDTDSAKIYANDKDIMNNIEGLIKNFNDKKIQDNITNDRFYQFKKKYKVSDENLLKIAKLGIWEKEDKEPHKVFKTLGAKKYIYQDYEGNIKSTIAGCSKQKIPILIENYCKRYNKTIEEGIREIFNTGSIFDETISGRTTATRESRPKEMFYNLHYKGKLINQFGGIIIENTTYTLSSAINDYDAINNCKKKKYYCKYNINGSYEYVYQ